MKQDLEQLQKKLAAMLASRPEMPRPFIPNSPEAIAWFKAYEKWKADHDDLREQINVHGYSPKGRVGFWDDPYKD